jgi:hypothetical protein
VSHTKPKGFRLLCVKMYNWHFGCVKHLIMTARWWQLPTASEPVSVHVRLSWSSSCWPVLLAADVWVDRGWWLVAGHSCCLWCCRMPLRLARP